MSFLSVNLHPQPLNELDGLADYPAGLASFGKDIEGVFARSEREVYRRLATKHYMMSDSQLAFQKVEKGEIVLMDSRSSINFNIRKSFTNE